MSVERAILAAARQEFNNHDVKLRDIRLIKAGAEPEEGQATGYLVDPARWVSVPSAMDRRGEPVQPPRAPPPKPLPRADQTPAPKPAIPTLPPQPKKRRV